MQFLPPYSPDLNPAEEISRKWSIISCKINQSWKHLVRNHDITLQGFCTITADDCYGYFSHAGCVGYLDKCIYAYIYHTASFCTITYAHAPVQHSLSLLILIKTNFFCSSNSSSVNTVPPCSSCDYLTFDRSIPEILALLLGEIPIAVWGVLSELSVVISDEAVHTEKFWGAVSLYWHQQRTVHPF